MEQNLYFHNANTLSSILMTDILKIDFDDEKIDWKKQSKVIFFQKSIKPRLNTIGTEILSKVWLSSNTEAILKRRANEVIIMNITKHKTVNTDNKTTATNISESFQVWIFNYWFWLIDQKNSSWKKIIENSSALPVKKYCIKQSIFWGSSFISLRILYFRKVIRCSKLQLWEG